MKKVIIGLFFVFLNLIAQSADSSIFFNPDYSIEERVNDLVTRMTLEEKISQMQNDAPEIQRLNIPEYNWWNECLHGVARSGYATVFPQAIGLAATWNENLIKDVGDVISTEARAKHHEAVRNGIRRIYYGLTFWTPNINIFRDPRWGRGQETYGEDPYLTSRIGLAFVKGLQGDDPEYFKVIATPKHYAVHSGPEPERHTFDAVASKRDLYDTYLPAFETCVKEGKAYSIMCAYNRFEGEACCGSDRLLQKILRDDWGFDGYVVSDCGAIYDIYGNHNLTDSEEEASALAVKSGTDLNCGGTYESSLEEAVKEGFISEDQIDVSVKRLFKARLKLGMFDPAKNARYSQIPFDKNDSEENRQLARKVAQESIVLLKNENDILPISKDLNKIAVIGPTANSYEMLLGNYSGTPSKYTTPLTGIVNKVANQVKIEYEQGCNLVEDGLIINNISMNDVSAKGKKGLFAEVFDNAEFKGTPIFTKIDDLQNSNWIWGLRVPNLKRGSKFSVRWTGKIKVNGSGNYKFIAKANNGNKLIINGKVLIDNQPDKDTLEVNNIIYLEKNKEYDILVEYRSLNDSPNLLLQWSLIDKNGFVNAKKLAEESDVVIFVGGITAQLEGEEMKVDLEGFKGGDRTTLNLPKVQEDLLKILQSTGKPVILVLTSGSALSVNWEDQNIPAIIQLWYPGEEGGNALADVLFGDYNPAGRLPVTFYKSVDQLPPFEDYSMKGRTYRYFEGEPLYPFGYGLSYTKFEYNNLTVPDTILCGESIDISVDVNNSGEIRGEEVVQLYLSYPGSEIKAPLKVLKRFSRVSIEPGETKTIRFKIGEKEYALLNENADYIIEPGKIIITAGGILPDWEAATTENISKEIVLKGNHKVVN